LRLKKIFHDDYRDFFAVKTVQTFESVKTLESTKEVYGSQCTRIFTYIVINDGVRLNIVHVRNAFDKLTLNNVRLIQSYLFNVVYSSALSRRPICMLAVLIQYKKAVLSQR